MKIALICDSLLLDRSLEMYLKEHLTSYKLCDFVVATQMIESQKPVFLIGDFEGANLKIPFTREILFQELETFERKLRSKAMQETKSQEFGILETTNSPFLNAESQPNMQALGSRASDSTLRTKIEEVLQRYANEIEAIIQEHYRDKNV
ncbi:hypothetical protein [Helicobacter sp.]|uniref:hypothetical protein n=1 Tax=Helicobacter sp. TaxID=218 RepID=UPI0019850C7E|nr:hypothetical protein [Helicobacter sp.]MBD5166107.1 hypothetical protein [Helicobacter sp.]